MGWWMVAALTAFFVKGLCGFANTLVFNAIMSFGQSNLAITPVELLVSAPSNLLMAWKERRAINWKICLPLCAVLLGGCIPGALLLKNVNADAVKLLCGAVIAGLGLEMLCRNPGTGQKKQSRIGMLLTGLLSGVLCGLFGVGALMGAYLSRVTEDSHAFKANLCVVFLAENVFRLFWYAWLGMLTMETLARALPLYPMMLLGLWLGMRSSRVLDEKTARRVVLVMLIISGAVLIGAGLTALAGA